MKTPELAQIADILPPPLPVSAAGHSGLYVVLTVAFISVVIWFLTSRSHAWQLHRLRRQHQQQTINNRQLAFNLAQLLCHEYHLPRFSPLLAPEHIDDNNWHNFAAELHTARFSRHSLDNDSLMQLLEKTRHWLQKKP